MRCYWNKPEATKKAIVSIDGDPGWFRTGDIAVMDEDSAIYIVGALLDEICKDEGMFFFEGG